MKGKVENLKPFKPADASTVEEAKRHKELSAKGGMASGESRRRKVSLREELQALLSLDDGTVAKGIVVAIAREAKNGDVAAFRAIAQVLGEFQQPELPVAVGSPIIIRPFDSEWVKAEKEKQEALHDQQLEIELPSQDQLAEIAKRRAERNARDEREMCKTSGM